MKKILLVISLISILFLVGCKTNENEINDKNNEVIIENEQQEVVDWVYDANYEKDITVDSYETEFGEVYNAKDIIVPFINIDSEDAVEANDEIKQIFDSAINNFNSGVSDKMTYVDECSYKEYINNNKLSVVVTYGVGATDVVHPEYYTYNFDLENGNEFSYEEAYAYAGLDSTNIDDNVKNAIRYKMKERFGSALVGEDFENYTNRSIENYENSLKDNTIKYFINEKGNLNIIVTLEAPVGRETFDTIVEVHSNDEIPNNIIVNETNQNEIDDELKSDEAMIIIQNYLNLQGEQEGSYEAFLESLELVDEVTFDRSVTVQDPNGISELWRTNIKYEEFKEKLLAYMSLNRFETFTKGFEEKDGYLYTLPLGASGYTFELYEIELKEKNDNHYVYTVKAIIREVELVKEYTIEATLIKENGKFVLDNYEYIQVQNISFDERTANFFEKQEEIKGDILRKEFNNIRLTKVDNYYELKADLIGALKIETQTLENAIKQIKNDKLEKLEIKTTSGEIVTIYSSKPKEIIDWHENEKNSSFYNENELDFYESGVLLYDDADWLDAESNEEWLDKNGVPMYVTTEDYYGQPWVRVSKQKDGYYLITRDALEFSMIGNLDTETGLAPIHGIVEKDAITIKLLANDKIVLDINDFYGNLPDDFKPHILTVEEYYNLSPKDGTAYTTEDNLAINISNMSDSNYYDIGLEIKDGMIYVVARNDGP